MHLSYVGNVEYMKENIAVLKIAYGQLNYDYIEEKVLYSGRDLIGELQYIHNYICVRVLKVFLTHLHCCFVAIIKDHHQLIDQQP